MKTIRISIIAAIFSLMALNGKAQNFLSDWDYGRQGLGFYMGYSSQQFKVTTGDFFYSTDGIWENRNRLHGVSLGLAAQSNWLYGLGLYWNMTLDMYLSTNNATSTTQASTISEAYDSYFELGFQMPLHVAFKLPLAKVFAIGFHTGPGATASCVAIYSDSRGYYNKMNPLKEKYFKYYNITYDCAVFFEVFNCRIDVQWSTGLINQQSSDLWDQLTRDKFMVGLTIFGR